MPVSSSIMFIMYRQEEVHSVYIRELRLEEALGDRDGAARQSEAKAKAAPWGDGENSGASIQGDTSIIKVKGRGPFGVPARLRCYSAFFLHSSGTCTSSRYGLGSQRLYGARKPHR
jgi:hypothetical protein